MSHSARSGFFTSFNVLFFLTISTLSSSMNLFSVRVIELNNSRLIATSNYNYAIVSPKLTEKNWRTVSVNGDSILVSTLDGQKLSTTKAEVGQPNVLFLDNLREELASGNNGGYTHVSSSLSTGNGPTTGTSTSNGGIISSYSSSSTGTSSVSTSSGNGGKLNNMDISMKDDTNFSVSRSDLPFNWSQVIYNNDLVTIIQRDGQVKMLPINLWDALELEAVNKLKRDMKDMLENQNKQMANTMQQSMNMVSSVFSNIMGRFPTPPDYTSAVGNMFGQNFPFGPNNSPFSASAGFPFASGNGAFAGAIAGRR